MLLVQQGDRQAFEVLFERWRDPIWSFLVRRTGDAESASDLYQEVFLRVWRSAGTWRAGERFRPWIYRIAANVGRDRFRRSTREVITVEIDPERGGTFVDPLAAVDVERALVQLPNSLREAFLLGALSGLDHNEVAAALGITAANARARISRARVALRSILLGAPPGEEVE
jgi:RNA polymerase sigma factor (sigma-70 family)